MSLVRRASCGWPRTKTMQHARSAGSGINTSSSWPRRQPATHHFTCNLYISRNITGLSTLSLTTHHHQFYRTNTLSSAEPSWRNHLRFFAILPSEAVSVITASTSLFANPPEAALIGLLFIRAQLHAFQRASPFISIPCSISASSHVRPTARRTQFTSDVRKFSVFWGSLF